MKRIKCWKCGTLIKPSDIIDHLQNCSGREEEHSIVVQENKESESQSKRQRLDNDDVEKKQRVKMEDDSTKLACSKCGKQFSRKFNCVRHENKCQGAAQLKTMITACKKCGKQFSDYRNRLRHERTCGFNKSSASASFSCASCGGTFSSVSDLTEHEKQTSHNRPGASGRSTSTSSSSSSTNNNNIKNNTSINEMCLNKTKDTSQKQHQPLCRMCGTRFANFKDLYSHRMLIHKQKGTLQEDPWVQSNETPPWTNEDGSENEGLRSVYDQHRHLILRARVNEGVVRATYNFPVSNLSNVDQLMEQVEFIFQSTQNAFKINLSFGLILQNIDTRLYRYFAPHFTDGLFLFPQLINNRQDIEKLRSRLAKLDLSNYFQKQKPNSKWKPVVITNVLYTVYKTSFPLGLSQPLPGYIRNSKSIVSFEKNLHSGRLYTDSLCFFRCLAFHRYKPIKCERMVTELHQIWLQYAQDNNLKSTDINLDIIPDLEACFETNINVYEMNEDKTVTILYKSRELFSKENPATMNLNLFSDHLSYISRFNSYATKFKCRLCEKLFNKKCNLVRHEKICQNATKLRFPGGYFTPAKTIFEKLAMLGISTDDHLQTYPWFLTFDMEAMLKCSDEEAGECLTKVSRHEPISVSICSNVDGFTNPKFILDPDFDSLTSKMVNYMNEVSNEVYVHAKKRWAREFNELETLECKWRKTENEKNNALTGVSADNIASDYDDDDDDDDDDDGGGGENMETNECEPASAEFVHAISKENVWYRLLQNIESTGNVEVEYNNWDTYSNTSSNDRRSSSISSSKSDAAVDDDQRADNTNIDCSSSRSSSSDEEDNILRFRPLNSKRIEYIDDDDDDDGGDDDDDDEYRGVDHSTFPETSVQMVRLIQRVREQFETYCHQVPVLGFNSAKYDLNLLKSNLSKHLRLHEPNQQKFVVKKNNSYMCLSNPKLRFLDMLNYLPPGTSYEKFLSTFGVNQSKSFFPYEYFADISVLEETTLPPKETFYSSLKQCNVLENSARVRFERMTAEENKTESEALSILKMNTPPTSSIEENYQSLLEIWEQNHMSTFRDFLEYYNNLDVLPMVEGVEKFKTYFVERGIDVFKESISVPGAARKMLYKIGLDAGASFPLIDKRDEDLYHTIKSNIIGGPSIIFTRYQEAGRTNIRENQAFPCRSVLGYDANSLYVYALSQPMPCGNYIRRKKENSFKPMKTINRYTSMYDWMEYLNHSKSIHIKHKMNAGNEKRIGPYLVDGYDSSTGTVYEFLGCYFHGHSCIKPTNSEQHKKRFTRTQERLAYLRSCGYKIVLIWECDYRKQVEECTEMRNFIDQRYPAFYRLHKGKLTESQIIHAVVEEKLSGFVEVDIKVPDSWHEVKFKPETDLSPEQYFEEMSPLFCTTEVEFASIGEHMQNHARTYGLSTNPRTLLVGGMKAECILLSSSLLKWYIEHGLLVTKIYQVIEFAMLPCFQGFVNNITNDRRQGDIDKSQELKGSLSKLIGNSAFGGTIINQEKFQKIKYMKGFKKACFAVNNPRFRQLNELGDDMFESEFANANISINSPTYLGFMILQYAKLHMLSFYFDFLIKFVGKQKFEMAEMDTDSLYFGLAGDNLRECIKPELLSSFDQNIMGSCKDNFTGDHFKTVWFPRECCSKHAKYDMRSPGVMKLEFRGTKIIALSSKSYITTNEDSNHKTIKYSLKGVNNRFLDPSNSFAKVLNSQTPISAVNRGIRVFNNTLFTYVQPKKAFNYFYCKRFVLPDGVHTRPLDVVLKPINRYRKLRNETEEELQSFINSICT